MDATKWFNVPVSEVYRNTRLKFYPDADGAPVLGSVECFSDGLGFKLDGFELIAGASAVRRIPENYNVDGSAKGRSRARTRLFDLVRCNWDLDCMFTLTFDRAVIDRTSYDEIMRSMRVWFDNRVRRNGLKYVAVPEYHADGKAVHFHGVCNFSALQTKWSGHVQQHKRVYNISDFPFGFTAVKKIGGGEADRHAVSIYVAKYITKGGVKVGGRYYLHGGDLQTPTVHLCEMTPDDIDALISAYGENTKAFTMNTPGGTYTKHTILPKIPSPEAL